MKKQKNGFFISFMRTEGKIFYYTSEQPFYIFSLTKIILLKTHLSLSSLKPAGFYKLKHFTIQRKKVK